MQSKKPEDALAQFIAGVKKPDRRLFSQVAREAMVQKFKEQYNSVFLKRRFQELHAAVTHTLQKVSKQPDTTDMRVALSEAIDTVLQTWANEWVYFPLGDPEHLILMVENGSSPSSEGAAPLSIEYGVGLTCIARGLSELDAVTGHPLAWDDFVAFIKDFE